MASAPLNFSPIKFLKPHSYYYLDKSLLMTELAPMPLTKWNQIRAELVEMWQIVKAAEQFNLMQTKAL